RAVRSRLSRRAALGWTTRLGTAVMGASFLSRSPVSASQPGAAIMSQSTPEATPAAGSGTPVVVLVHGSFADASGWADVITELRSSGISVMVRANPLRSVSGDAAYIASVVNQIPGPVLLVGHSYGGMVITNAAPQACNVVGLVYIAAFLPDEGESVL